MSSATFVRPSLAALVLLLLAAPSRADTLKVPAEFGTIQLAVDAAVAGDVVLVSKGTYEENVLVTTAGIALRGKNAVIDGHYEGTCLLVQASDVEVSNFTLANGGGPLSVGAQPGDGGLVGGLHVVGTGALISKVKVLACEDFGILLEGTGVVENCEVDACVGTGLAVETGNVLGEIVTEVVKNEVKRCVQGIVLEDGPFLVERNTVEANADGGLQVIIPPPVVEGVPQALPTTISKNTCRGNAEAGLFVFKGTGPALSIDKNVVEDNGLGLDLTGSLIDVTNCSIDRNLVGGAFLNTTQGSFVKNKVRGNGFSGVIVRSAGSSGDGDGEDGGNLIDGNLVQDNGGDGVHSESNSNVISGNILKNNLGDGVHLIAGGVFGNQVVGNTVTGNGHDGIDNSASGTLISGNVCKDNGGSDLAGAGSGSGTTDPASADNVSKDGTGLGTLGALDLDTTLV